MKNYFSLLKIAFKRWSLFVVTAFSMFGYALFSAASVPLFIPLMDDVLNREYKEKYLINDLGHFLSVTSDKISIYFSGNNISIDKLGESTNNISSVMKDLFLNTDPLVLLIAVIYGMLALTILKLIFYVINRMAVLKIEGKTTRDLKNILFKKYVNFPFGFFEFHKVGDALVRISGDVTFITAKLVAVVLNNIRDVLLLLLYLISAIFLNPGLFLKILIFIPPLLWFTGFLGKKMKKYTIRLQEQLELIFNKIEEVFRGLKIVRAFHREQSEKNRFGEIAEKEYKLWYRRSIYDMLNMPMGELSGMGIAIAILWFGGKAVLDPAGNFSFGQFMAFLTAILLTLNPLKATLKNWGDIKKASASLDRIFDILNTKTAIKEKQKAELITGFYKNIELDNVDFAYDSKRDAMALSGVTLTIEKGEKVAFVGATGSGKTTLVNLLPRFYDVNKGEIRIDGKNVKDIKISDLRKLFGYVTQDSFLFNETIAYNVAYPLEKIDIEKVINACEVANATEFIEKLPQKYDTMISNYGANFSGGQRQRLCIARAIIGDPDILIFDEATSALDSEAEVKVQDAINKATKEKTLVVIAHRLSTIINSDKIVVVKDGKIEALGKHEELMRKCGEYKKLYDLQFQDQNQKESDEPF